MPTMQQHIPEKAFICSRAACLAVEGCEERRSANCFCTLIWGDDASRGTRCGGQGGGLNPPHTHGFRWSWKALNSDFRTPRNEVKLVPNEVQRVGLWHADALLFWRREEILSLIRGKRELGLTGLFGL